MSAVDPDKSFLRPPPAYQTFASDDLANEAYYDMGLAERGLYDAMMRAVWAGGSVPKEPTALAKVVRVTPDEVRAALTDKVMKSFIPDPENGDRLINVELRRQAAKLEARRAKQVAGAQRTNDARKGKPAGGDADRKG